MGFKRSGQAAAGLALSRGCRDIFISSNIPFNDEERIFIEENSLVCETSHSDKLLKCDMIVVSPGIPYSNNYIMKAVKSGIEVIPEVEFAYMLSKIRIIGITGTNGKSTTAHLTHQLLTMGGIKSSLGGNISPGKPLSSIVADNDADIIVCELSSFQLEHIDKFTPYISIITNISPDHLDRHSSMEEYIKAKLRIFENHDSSNIAVLNADDPILRDIDTVSEIIYTSLSDSKADIYYSNGYISLPGSKISIDKYKLPGNHNKANLMQALAAYISFTGNENDLESFIPGLEPMVHRMEYVGTVRGHRLYNNSMCTNPVAFRSSVKSLTKDQIVIVGGRNKDFDISAIIDSIVSSTSGAVLIGEMAEILEQRLMKRSFDNIKKAATMKDAVKYAFEIARDNAPVNFSPGFSSFDMYRDFAHRGETFKEEAAKWA